MVGVGTDDGGRGRDMGQETGAGEETGVRGRRKGIGTGAS